MENKLKRGRPAKAEPTSSVTLNLRITESDRELLRELTRLMGNISDTDTVRRLIRAEHSRLKR